METQPNPPTAKQRLVEALGQAGKPTHLERFPDGSEVLVLRHGGRVLGLFAPGSGENFLWTNTALDAADSAARFYAGDQWHNSGGDRTWLSPEADFFFPNFPKLDVYFQPRSLDPGEWLVLDHATGRSLANVVRCRMTRSKREVELVIRKRVEPAANPLGHEPGGDWLARVEYAGYTLHTTLDLADPQAQPANPVGLWSLLQMPHGGELLVPTYSRTEPKVLFGSIPTADLTSGERMVRYAMRAEGEQKIAIRAVAAAGRIGYRYPSADGRWALIVRNVFIDPSGLYVDVPWTDLDDFGYAIQACNIHSGLGSFSELEYHVPAIGPGTGRTRSDDVSQVWAFRGGRAEIDRIAAALLGPEPQA